MPARIVLACWGSYGDVFPYVALALGLRAAGHTPVVATCPYYRALIEAEGLEFAPLRPDVDPGDTALITRVLDRRRGPEVVIREIAAAAVGDAYADLSAAVAGADALVSHPITFAGPIVAEERRMPWLSTVLAPISLFSVHDFPVLPGVPLVAPLSRLGPWVPRLFMRAARRMSASWVAPVHAFRASRGLPRGPDPLYEGFSPFGTLALFSPIIGAPQPDWPRNTHATGFAFYNRAIPMPGELRAFLDRGNPPIVFTLGSSAVMAPGSFFEASAAAAARLGRRAVLLTGLDPASIPRGLSSDMIAVPRAPHDALFAQAAVVVHPGGIGTTGQALRSGRPMLVVPHAHDQPDNAARVKRLGVARVLDPRRYRSDAAARHISALLDDRRYTVTAADVGRRIGAERGVETACRLLLSAIDRSH